MSSESSTIASSSPLSFTDGNAADGERFLADASARLAESLDVYATIRTLSELAVESFADGCRITLVDEGARARGEYPYTHVAVFSRCNQGPTKLRLRDASQIRAFELR